MPRHAQQPRSRRRAAPRADAATSTAVSDEFLGLGPTLAWPTPGLEIAVPDLDMGRSTPCMLLQSAGQATLALVQICAWETLSPAWAGVNTGAQVPVVIWNTSGTIAPMPQSLGGFAGTSAWTMSGADLYFAADVDGDAADEILAVQDGSIAILKWAGDALYVWWSAANAPGINGASSWPPTSLDRYVPVLFGLGPVSGEESFFAWSGDELAVLSWQGDALNAVWTSAGTELPGGWMGMPWKLETTDPCWRMDVAGQGFDSILLTKAAGGAMGLVQWDADAAAPSLVWSAALHLLDTNGDPAWPLQAGDQCVPCDIGAGAPWQQSLVLFNAQDLTIGVAQFDNDPDSPQMQVIWSGQGSVPNEDGGADLPLDANDVLLALAVQSYDPTVLLARAGSIGAVIWGGDALIVQWVQQGASFPGAGGTSAWNTQDDVYTPVAGPATGQQQLLASKPTAPQPGYYGLLVFDADGNVSCGWGTNVLHGQVSFPGWNLPLIAGAPAGSLAQQDFDPTAVEQLYSNLLALADALKTQWDADLAHVIAAVNPDSDAPQVTFSWPALLSALNAVGITPGGQVASAGTALALLAAVLPGPLLQYEQSTQTVDCSKIQPIIDGAFGHIDSGNPFGVAAIETDRTKGALVAAMAQQGGWAWPQLANADIAAATQTGNRMQFYAMVIPAAYTIYYQQTDGQHMTGVRWQKTPSWAQWNAHLADEPWVYAIATGDNILMDFPSEDMMDEILAAVTPAQFYLGQGAWAGLKRVNW